MPIPSKSYYPRADLTVRLVAPRKYNTTQIRHLIGKEHYSAALIEGAERSELTEIVADVKSTDRIVDPFVHPISLRAFKALSLLPEFERKPVYTLFGEYATALEYFSAMRGYYVPNVEAELQKILKAVGDEILDDITQIEIESSIDLTYQLQKILDVVKRETVRNIQRELASVNGSVLIYCGKSFAPTVEEAIAGVNI